MGTLLKNALIFLIRLYQAFPLPPTCRFVPSCSNYAIEAIERFGARKGLYLALKRVLRCHPFNPGGYDPVPLNLKEK